MPRTQDEIDRALIAVEARVGRLETRLTDVVARLTKIEQSLATIPAPAESLAKLVVAVAPIAQHAERIIATQAGALGVGK